MARKGILSTGSPEASPPGDTPASGRRTQPAAPRGAVGALQSSLTKLQENAVQEIEPDKIRDAGVTDRLGEDAEADQSLQDSLRTYGQQVPVLVRPNSENPELYDIVYGRRRVRALKALGMPVKAMVRRLDDEALVLAQGQENTARKDLSFIEKASFAAQLDALSYDRQTICAALSIDAPMLSRMLRVGRAFSIEFLRYIGSAPGIGRDRWLKLAEAIDRPGAVERIEARLSVLKHTLDSDERFEQVAAWAEGVAAPPPKPTRGIGHPTRRVRSPGGFPIGQVKRSDKALVLTLPHGDAPDFTHWVDSQAEDLMQELYDRWIKSRSED